MLDLELIHVSLYFGSTIGDGNRTEIESERFNQILTSFVYSGPAVVAMATPAAFAPTFVRLSTWSTSNYTARTDKIQPRNLIRAIRTICGHKKHR